VFSLNGAALAGSVGVLVIWTSNVELSACWCEACACVCCSYSALIMNCCLSHSLS